MYTLHLQWSSSAPWVFELAFDHQPVRLARKDLACDPLGDWLRPRVHDVGKKRFTLDLAPRFIVPTFHVMRSSKASWENRVSKSTSLFGRYCGILFIRYSLSLAPSFFLELRPWQSLDAHNSWETKRRASQNPERIATVSYHTKSWFQEF